MSKMTLKPGSTQQKVEFDIEGGEIGSDESFEGEE